MFKKIFNISIKSLGIGASIVNKAIPNGILIELSIRLAKELVKRTKTKHDDKFYKIVVESSNYSEKEKARLLKNI